MKIAVIGSGIAGLSAAYWLSQDERNRVTLIERSDTIGLAAHGDRISLEDGTILSLDVPPRMIGPSLWPQLCDLYDEVGVERIPVCPSQSFNEQVDGRTACYLSLNDATRPSPSDLLSSRTRAIFRDVKRLMKQGRQDLANSLTHDVTLADYLRRNRYSDDFVLSFLYPTLASTVCTCNYDDLDAYPAELILTALAALTNDTSLFRVVGGTAEVASALSASVAETRFKCEVQSIRPVSGGVEVSFDGSDLETFDHVVLATQANTAERLLTHVEDTERELLLQIGYSTTSVTLHQDDRFMPQNRRRWGTFNMSASPADRTAACTVWMNRFNDTNASSRQAGHNFFQTIIPQVGDEGDLLGQAGLLAADSIVRLQRPTVNLGTRGVIQQLMDRQQAPGRRVWFAGSWAEYGIPLLESAVASSLRCVQSIAQRHLTASPAD